MDQNTFFRESFTCSVSLLCTPGALQCGEPREQLTHTAESDIGKCTACSTLTCLSLTKADALVASKMQFRSRA
jgi:hypothetical protein